MPKLQRDPTTGKVYRRQRKLVRAGEGVECCCPEGCCSDLSCATAQSTCDCTPTGLTITLSGLQIYTGCFAVDATNNCFDVEGCAESFQASGAWEDLTVCLSQRQTGVAAGCAWEYTGPSPVTARIFRSPACDDVACELDTIGITLQRVHTAPGAVATLELSVTLIDAACPDTGIVGVVLFNGGVNIPAGEGDPCVGAVEIPNDWDYVDPPDWCDRGNGNTMYPGGGGTAVISECCAGYTGTALPPVDEFSECAAGGCGACCGEITVAVNGGGLDPSYVLGITGDCLWEGASPSDTISCDANGVYELALGEAQRWYARADGRCPASIPVSEWHTCGDAGATLTSLTCT